MGFMVKSMNWFRDGHAQFTGEAILEFEDEDTANRVVAAMSNVSIKGREVIAKVHDPEVKATNRECSVIFMNISFNISETVYRSVEEFE